METRPQQVDKIMADINDKVHVIQSLAKKVERNEGRGGLKVSSTFMDRLICLVLSGK